MILVGQVERGAKLNKIIITLLCNQKDIAIDLELDKEQLIRDCITDIVDTLENFDLRMSFNRGKARLFSERLGSQLDENVTVEEAGIWNGDYIHIMEIQNKKPDRHINKKEKKYGKRTDWINT